MHAVALKVGAGQGKAHPWVSATFPTPPTGFPLGFPYRCGQIWIACGPFRGSFVRVETSGRLYRFAGALERLLAAPDAQAFERAWETAHVDRLAWDALGGARRADSEALEPALDQVDRRLLAMLERSRGDQLLRRFLGPKILESLYVLGEECSLPLFEELLVAGHTDPDVDRCEVTRALVMVRRATGRVAQSCKFADGDEGVVLRTLDEAERRFEATRDRIVPVVVI